jgi:hypothetical protein
MGGPYYKMEDERIPQKMVLMGNFITKDQWENQEQDGKSPPEGCVTVPRNKRVEETNISRRKREASSEGHQGSEWAAAPYMEWNPRLV